MRGWMVAASLVLVACGARSELVPGVGGTSGAGGGAGGGTPPTGGSGLSGSGFGGTGGVATGGSGFGGTGGVATGGSGFGGGGSGGGGFGGGGGTPGAGGSPGSGGSGGTPGACNPAFCPSTGTGTPCCVTGNGPCGIDEGTGCKEGGGEGGGLCAPPKPGATCDLVPSGNPACDSCLQANCCNQISACRADPHCSAVAACAQAHGCIGKQGQAFTDCLQACGAQIGFTLYASALKCGLQCCGSTCT